MGNRGMPFGQNGICTYNPDGSINEAYPTMEERQQAQDEIDARQEAGSDSPSLDALYYRYQLDNGMDPDGLVHISRGKPTVVNQAPPVGRDTSRAGNYGRDIYDVDSTYPDSIEDLG